MVASQIFLKSPVAKDALHVVNAPGNTLVKTPGNVPSNTPGNASFNPPATGASVVPFDIHKIKEALKQSAYKVVVVKIGGTAISNEPVLDALIDDALTLIKANIKIVIVHGGGIAVNKALAEAGKQTKKVNGLRVTDTETLAIAVKVFGEINQYLVEKFQQRGASALGFCHASAMPFKSKKMACAFESGEGVDLGWVGEIEELNGGSLDSWLFAGWTPVVAPLGIDENGQLYNLNADHAALALATGLETDGLIFMTDVPGVLQDASNYQTRLNHLTPRSAQHLIEEGTITGGMLPKIKSCLNGIAAGIDQIAILNSFDANALLRGFVAPQDTGTLITGESHDY